MATTHDLMSKIVDIDLVRGRATFEFSFLTPQQLQDLERLYVENKIFKQSIKFPTRHSKSYEQQKKWYATLTEMLKAKRIMVTHDRLDMLDETMRRSLFPARFADFEGKKIPYIPPMKELSWEEMNDVLVKLVDRYDYILKNIQFTTEGIMVSL